MVFQGKFTLIYSLITHEVYILIPTAGDRVNGGIMDTYILSKLPPVSFICDL